MRSSTEVTPVVPAGWKLVPIEPTEEMKVAGCDHDDPLGRLVDWQGKDVTTREVVAGVFGAMIAAAPTPIDQTAGLTAWAGWDQSDLPWSEAKHKDAVCYAVFGGTWSMNDAEALIGFIDRTWPRAAATEADHG